MLPHLIHPIYVFLRKADKAWTAQDANLHEPIGQVRRQQTPTKLQAQVSWGMDARTEQAQVGTTASSDGYLLFRTYDLRQNRITIEVGDRITQIGDGAAAQTTDLYVVGLKWQGHYPDQHGATLLRAYFEDRAPGRQRV